MPLSLFFQLAWRNLWRNKQRSSLLLLVVTLGVAALVAFNAFMLAWGKSSVQAGLQNLTGSIQLHAKGYLQQPKTALNFKLPETQLDAWQQQNIAFAQRVRVPAIVQSEYKTMPVNLIGIEPKRELAVTFLSASKFDGNMLVSSQAQGIVLGAKLVKRLKTKLGRRIVMMAQNAQGKMVERGFRLVGIFHASEANEYNFAFIGLKPAQQWLALNDHISEVSLLLPQSQVAQQTQQLSHQFPQLEVKNWQQLLPMASAMTQMSDSFIWVWLAIMFTLLAFGIVNTMLMALFERKKELGLLQALGLQPKYILLQVMLETLMLLALGILFGLSIGAAFIQYFSTGLDLSFVAKGMEWLGAGRVIYPEIIPIQFLISGLSIWLLGALVTAWPVYKTVKQSPVQTLSHAE